MAVFKPFKAFRPKTEYAKEVASLPYDVINSDEARELVIGKPLSFIHVGKPEVDLNPSISIYDPKVYEKGKENLQKLINDKILVQDQSNLFYIYTLTMNGREQNGIVGCASVDDYWNNVIKKHEYTRKTKEEDRCNHVRVTNAHTGPIFLTFKENKRLSEIINLVKQNKPDNDHIAEDNVRHQTWLVEDFKFIEEIEQIFGNMHSLYVADGHHRSAAAAIVGNERKESNPNHRGNEEYNYFLAVAFADSELFIMDYNRVVKDLNGMTEDEFLINIQEYFSIEKTTGLVKPDNKGEFGLYLGNGNWYKLNIKNKFINESDPVESLDVALLQKYLLDEFLNIKDPRTDERIDFVGGIRGIEELVKRVDSGEMKIAISMYPTSIDELINIADSGSVMPPKSTWFEPKLRDGLFIHLLD